jgi:hypothetical protein
MCSAAHRPGARVRAHGCTRRPRVCSAQAEWGHCDCTDETEPVGCACHSVSRSNLHAWYAPNRCI